MNSRKVSETLKKQVAYEQQYKCSSCSILLPSSYQIDHIIPHSISSDDSRPNLTALCPTCHANKTQQERSRILYYKKKVAETGRANLCYFCLDYNCNGYCDRTLKSVPKSNTVVKTKKSVSSLFRFAHVENEESILSSSIQNISLEDTTLRIKISREYIYVNNFFTKVVNEELTPRDLGNTVKEVTKNMYSRYTDVEIDIIVKNHGGEGGDACINYFSSVLHSEMPVHIFKDYDNVKYTYFVDED